MNWIEKERSVELKLYNILRVNKRYLEKFCGSLECKHVNNLLEATNLDQYKGVLEAIG